MVNSNKLLFLLAFSLILIPGVLASSLEVSVTDSQELAFTILSDDLDWQSSRIEIYNNKDNLVYEFEDYIYYTADPTFQLLDCPNCKPGNYVVNMKINQTEITDTFFIEKECFDWFWLILVTLILTLWFFGRYNLAKHHKHHSKKIAKAKK